MMSTRKFVAALSEDDQAALEQMHLHGRATRQRQRAHAVLLSAQGFTLDQLADILRADRDTVSGWLNQWQEQGLAGLADAPKSGRKRKIDGSLEMLLRDILIENPSPNMRAVLQAEIKKREHKSPGTP
jgi:transposase